MIGIPVCQPNLINISRFISVVIQIFLDQNTMNLPNNVRSRPAQLLHATLNNYIHPRPQTGWEFVRDISFFHIKIPHQRFYIYGHNSEYKNDKDGKKVLLANPAGPVR